MGMVVLLTLAAGLVSGAVPNEAPSRVTKIKRDAGHDSELSNGTETGAAIRTGDAELSSATGASIA